MSTPFLLTAPCFCFYTPLQNINRINTKYHVRKAYIISMAGKYSAPTAYLHHRGRTWLCAFMTSFWWWQRQTNKFFSAIFNFLLNIVHFQCLHRKCRNRKKMYFVSKQYQHKCEVCISIYLYFIILQIVFKHDF